MDSEECEEWMVESIKLYKDLHDFELQDPTRVIEWIGEKSICVAGYDDTKSNEILQLLVPQKLQIKENQGLCPERDLKVEHGGFTQYPVYSLKHVPEHSLILTTGPASALVQVWQIGAEDKDVIKPTSTIQSDVGNDTWTKIATTAATSPRVLHGSRINNVQLTELESNKQIYTLATSGNEAIGSLSFLDVNTFLLCSLSGRLMLADIRQSGIAIEQNLALSASCNSQWIAAVKPEHSGITSLSSGGHITITDSRNLGAPLKCAKGRISEPCTPETFMCICWAPRLDNCISISGFDGNIQIYNTESWDETVQERDVLFTHRGHSVMGVCKDNSVPRVTCHTWHPWKERTLISAANDGSLHMWDWLDRCTGL
ncbi:PREDICTED: WD repeat-containing protein 73 [Nanorana parkeri]|uniref:WD repeat-containing protein 73 n=1 Tax=Nanorana parkeri TaxID=125878 RepID=UPI0008542F06|nr:PREDICTED: WD repeat-containing protein 73 [Nanorana parkeri]